MLLARNKLYGIIILACLSGYGWLYANWKEHTADKAGEHSICLIKYICKIPCPSCGSTRSVISILQGDMMKGIYLNPLGPILILIMTITPIWIIYDYIQQKSTFLQFYYHTETLLKQKKIAVPAMLLVLANWFWNIYKVI